MPAPRSVLLLLLLCAQLAGVRPVRAQDVAPGLFRLTPAGRKKAVVPFQMQRNLVIVSVYLNEKGPYNFLLDTGVNISLITAPALADTLKLRRGQPFRVVGAGGEATGLLAYETPAVRVRLGPAVAPGMHLLILSDDLLNLSGYVGIPIHGIMGSELFRSFVVTVWSARERLVLRPPTYSQLLGRRWASMPLTVEANKPYLTVPVALPDSAVRPLKLVLDTGAGHALSLETDSDPCLAVPARHVSAELGRGLTGIVHGALGRVASLQLGRYRIKQIVTSFPDNAEVHSRADVPRNGNIGYELLKRFSLIIDYPHERLFLKPNIHFGDPFEHDMCGLDLLAAGPDFRRYLVARVVPGSPAAAAGLLPDEELVFINLIPVSSLTLTQLSRLLHSEDGRLLFLVVRRADGEMYTTNVRLKRQI